MSENLVSKDYEIKVTAKSFSILSSSLYSNKVKAIIRELSCNAYDAHIAAGVEEVPFEIHLPTAIEPWFYVRDTGIGMDSNDVEEIYTTYFESTKTSSNKFIGAAGLGSKSPFSYTNNFTVTATKDGVCRVYTAYINNNGFPALVQLASNPTTEPNGVEVKFGVKSEDFTNFAHQASEILKYFPVKPIVTGQQLKIPELEYVEQNIIPGVHVRASTQRIQGYAVAVMGAVAYPIEVSSLSGKIPKHLLQYLNCNIVIQFKIGDLDFQPSREGLSYDNYTVKNIESVLQLLHDTLTQELESKVQSIDNIWNLVVCLNNISDNNVVRQIVIDEYILSKYSTDVYINSYISSNRYSLYPKNVMLADYNMKCMEIVYDYRKGRRVYRSFQRSRYQITRDAEQTLFVVNDTSVGALPTIKNHLSKSNDNKRIFVLDKVSQESPDFDRFFKDIGSPPESYTINVSSLEKPNVRKRQNNGCGIIEYNVNTHSLIDVKSAPTGTKYYIPLSNANCVGDHIKHVSYRDFARQFTKLKMFPYTVYGVRKSHVEEVKKDPDWINIETVLYSFFEKDYFGFLRRYSKYKALYNDRLLCDLHQNKHVFDENSMFYMLISEFDDRSIMRAHETYSALYWMSRFYVATSPNTATMFDYSKVSNQIRTLYPMLPPSYTYGLEFNDIVDYIKLVDQC